MLDTKYQAKQFENAAVDMLQNYLDPKTYNCKPAQVFLQQILAKVILETIVVSCSKPEWINGWIIHLLEESEPELLNAIDAGVEGSSGQLQNVKKQVEQRNDGSDANASAERREHKRAVSRAQEAMDEAMQEAKRLSQLIAEEDARRTTEQSASIASLPDDHSESTTQGIITPTSSQSETLIESHTTDLGMSGLATQVTSHDSLAPSTKATESPQEEARPAFTSFDQLIPQHPPTALMANPPPPLTLHNCNVVIFDDAEPGDNSTIKNKPTSEYLIQIEPSSNHHSGWMTARKYQDLETLHEVIRRIAAITGSSGFTEAHASLPTWKGHTKASLRGELERYLNDAVQYKPLAESEGMKRFLEKESQMGKTAGNKGFAGIGWPAQTFETMGKGMIDVLTKAPKEVAGGSKALFGGVTGVLGSVTAPLGGAKKRNTNPISSSPVPSCTPTTVSTSSQPFQTRHNRAESTISELPSLPTHIRTESTLSSLRRTSTDSLRGPNSPIVDQQPQREAPMERRPSYNPDGDGKRSGRSSVYASRSNSRAPSVRDSMDDLSPLMGGDQILNLPPIPTDIPDDYVTSPTRTSLDPYHHRMPSRGSSASLQLKEDAIPPVPRRPSTISLLSPITSKLSLSSPPKGSKPTKCFSPLSEPETMTLIDLFFAVTTQLYTLSQTWKIRLTLLSAAKTFLLRPGNPQLLSITSLLQSSILDANTSDTGIAHILLKIRQNALPTEEELKNWPAEMSQEEKEGLRVRARRVLMEKGMPAALVGVMGQAASGEALGKVFDALQETEVARGVMFGMVVQGLRAVAQ